MKDSVGWCWPLRRSRVRSGTQDRSRTDHLPRTTRMLTTLLAGALALAACESGDPASPSEVAEIRILSGSQAVAVRVDGAVKLEARGFDARGRVISGLAIDWQSLDPEVAEVDGAGRVTGLAVGEARIVATLGALADTTRVRVQEQTVGGWLQGKQLIGLHMDLPWDGYDWRRAEAIQAAKQVGAQVSRNSFLWHLIERNKGSRNWSRVDAVVNELEAAGLEPIFVIYGSPSWANGSSDYLYVPQSQSAFNAWVAEYARFVRAAVARYKDRVKLWEIWNEQNEPFFWKPAPDVDRYVEFYKAIYAAIKAEDPAAQVAMGGLAGLCCSVGIPGKKFLEQMYARGVKPDIVNIHPYAMANQAPDVMLQGENSFGHIQAIRNVMLAHGEGEKPIWVTEWGWATNKVSESVQAQYVERSLQMLVEQYPYVTVATYFLDYDRPPEYFHGLFTEDFRMKPAGARFRDFMQSR